MLPFITFGLPLVGAGIGLGVLLNSRKSDSPWMPILVLILIGSFIGTVSSIALATSAAFEFSQAEARGRELRELVENIDHIKDPLVKASAVVEAHEWNKRVEKAKDRNASQWSDIFWADGWDALRPIQIR